MRGRTGPGSRNTRGGWGPIPLTHLLMEAAPVLIHSFVHHSAEASRGGAASRGPRCRTITPTPAVKNQGPLWGDGNIQDFHCPIIYLRYELRIF